jgi:hypothetical protein
LPCYNQFVDATDTDAIWYGFPKTGYASYCKNGMATCADKDKETMSDTYSLFLQIDFAPADYLSGEATMAAKLLGRVESCTDAKLSAKKRAMWGEFLVNTAGSLGQKTNTGSIMEQVGAMTSGGGGAMGALGSIGGIATQFMAK